MITYKITLLGDAAVGKTSLRKQFMGKNFDHSYGMTIGADFAAYKFDNYNLHIWDLAGQIRFNNVIQAYFNGTRGSLLIFDITRPDSYENIPNWIDQLTSSLNGNTVPLMLVGNKSDLRDSASNPVDPAIAEQYARELSDWSGFNVEYLETSALTGKNVDLAFRSLVKEIDVHVGLSKK